MLEAVEALLPTIITVLELAAAVLLVLGFVVSTVLWLRDGLINKDPAARTRYRGAVALSLIHISEPTRLGMLSRMPSSA